MTSENNFDVIIIGGSYAGLSAAMALGRSLRKVLIIDSGKPCNRQTPHSHNFITQDGKTPGEILEEAKSQVLRYDTVKFYKGLATAGKKFNNGFEIKTSSGEILTSQKLLFATGISDQMPEINGFAESWGISVLHCPYCHGYEVKNQHIGLIGNGDLGFEFCRLISNWTKELTLFTNGKSALTNEQRQRIERHKIKIIEKEISFFEHTDGQIQNVVFNDNLKQPIAAVFTKVGFKQHCDIPRQLGCELTEEGFIKVDEFQKTTMHGIFAAGDNTTMFRSVSIAVAAGTKAGAFMNKELIEEAF